MDKFKKGDMIKLWNDDLALVLKSEVQGEDFFKECGRKQFNVLMGNGKYLKVIGNETDKNFVWHHVLVRDMKVWIIIDNNDEVIKV